MSAIGKSALLEMADAQREQAAIAELALAGRGVLPEMPLDDVLPDPENARRSDDEETPDAQERQAALDADVKERGG